MQAVILAGGLGTRLRPLTEQVPKPMVRVGGRPFLEYIIRLLASQGFCRHLLLVGYLGERIQNYFGDGIDFGVRIDYGWESRPLGTAGAIRNSLDKLDDSFLLLYGDSFLPIDYRAVVAAFLESNCLGLVVAYDNRLSGTGVQNNIAADEFGRVSRYEKSGSGPDLRYVEAGVLCLRRSLFAELPADSPVSLENEIYPRLITRQQLRIFLSRQRFFDIGTPGRLNEFALVQS